MARPGGILFCWRVRDGALDLVRFRTDVEDSAALRRTALPLRVAESGGSPTTIATTSTFRQFDATEPGPPGASSGIRRVSGFGFGNRPTPFLTSQQECSPLFLSPTLQGSA